MATKTTYLNDIAISSLLTTELNSVTNNSLALGSAYTLSGGYLLAELELVVTFGVAPAASTGIPVWLLRAVDGTNYEDGGDGTTTPARLPDLVFPLRAVTTLQRIARRVLIPPGTFKPLAKNDATGQTTAATANTLKVLPLTFQQT